jgi:hypothetical protein
MARDIAAFGPFGGERGGHSLAAPYVGVSGAPPFSGNLKVSLHHIPGAEIPWGSRRLRRPAPRR